MIKTQLKKTDTAIIEEIKAGDKSAFKVLVERYEQQIRGTVIGMLGVVPEAEEVAQDVFIRFYKSIENYKAEAKLSTYLTRIAINLSINELKRRQKKTSRWLSIFSKQDKVLQIKDTSQSLDRFEMRELIHQALQKLDPDFRKVVVLRLIEGYSVKETAEILQLPKGTVASRLSRAQQQLQKILKPILNA